MSPKVTVTAELTALHETRDKAVASFRKYQAWAEAALRRVDRAERLINAYHDRKQVETHAEEARAKQKAEAKKAQKGAKRDLQTP